MTSNNPPTQTETDAALAAYELIAGNSNYERWIDPLKIDQGLANTMGIYSLYEIYAPALGSNPYANKKVDFNLRSNTGHNITVTLKTTAGTLVSTQSMTMAKGDNYKFFNVDPSVSGTYVLSFISGINTISRTVVIN